MARSEKMAKSLRGGGVRDAVFLRTCDIHGDAPPVTLGEAMNRTALKPKILLP